TITTTTMLSTLSLHVALPIFPGLHEVLGLGDLVLPVRHRPFTDPAGAAAEVSVEMGTDLVALEPGQPQLLHGVGDALRVVEADRSEEHTSELQSRENLVCRLL